MVLYAPTGSGKTVIACKFIDDYLDENPNTVFLWLCPGAGGLQKQSQDSFEELTSGIQFGDVYSFINEQNPSGQVFFINWDKINSIHTVLHQVLELGVEDDYLRYNPSDNALKELKKAWNFEVEKRRALTVPEQELFEKFLSKQGQYHRWYPIFTIMLWTGMRVGEITGLRWCDIDLEEEVINVNHTLVYHCTRTEAGQIFAINTTKTKAGERTIPMLPIVKEAFIMEKEYQEECGIKSEAVVDGYRDFIFVNRFGNVQHQGTLNKALRRIIRDCNFEVLYKDHRDNAVILPKFSNHSLRHTFTTRMCEAGVNIKAMQDILGHADAETTMQIYAEATKDLKKSELINFEEYFDRLKDAQKKGEM